MKTIIITSKKYEVERTHSGYRSFSATIDGKDLVSTIDGGVTAVDFIEKAVSEVISQAIDNGETAIDITVNLPATITLSEALKTHLIDKYTADEMVSSVTFVDGSGAQG